MTFDEAYGVLGRSWETAKAERDYLRVIIKNQMRQIGWLEKVNAELMEIAKELAGAGVEFDDDRISWLSVQVDRDVMLKVRAIANAERINNEL